AIFYDQKAWQQKNLLISEKSQETNYLLYFNKREESRIAGALDRNRIVNVVVQAAPIVPGLPAHSPWLFVACALILALGVSIGYALVKDYFDESFRTPDEVKDLLDIPVLAAIPRNGF